ncbi:hypothetical protein [Micromonospora violae]|uniref:hypothetical protein n=1 Tax=Micromonospora violae TaxID=1278207 RepID=UPI0033FAD8FA
MLVAEAPKITDWMQAWGSLAGLVMSTAAVIFTGLLFRHEIRVRRDEKQDAEVAQARLVVGRIVHFGRNASVEPSGHVSGVISEFGWSVKNYSSAPILDVGVWVAHAEDEELEWHEERTWDVVEGEITGSIALRKSIDLGPENFEDPGNFDVVLVFVDAEGRSWLRHGRIEPFRTTGPHSRNPLLPTPRWPRRWLVERRDRKRRDKLLATWKDDIPF